ncbi:dipeptide ABC transporter ATP-binding protein [Tatumella citrea]|uniref:Glutathione import ATP-binding protein GsiA n=1 Tax=Tatumella citrea TaxID=53336 RepID=A0A1Y0L436_TATCI|nr:dipeptide ABC transporter ATP-binding protein [Tatumella citrea]ARU92761.1 glutathione ABC transporter ATP-binding protein GsiA [Tatumella citrea]ARU96799.1 glutathione ABC transporter ATP-binding protein GsiA [Tatumella citrea]
MTDIHTTMLHDPDRVLLAENLAVSFRRDNQIFQAVEQLSLSVSHGETLALVGESGSGKSVTSLALMGLIQQAGGEVTGDRWLRRRDGSLFDLGNADQQQLRTIRGADIAMIFQEPMTSLNPVFPVGEQIAESLRLHQGKSASQAWKEARELLERVRIPAAADTMTRYPHQLSGGMRQRVMIAMALSCRPALLIADEPTTALDVTVQAQILNLIRELQKDMHMGVIFITHDMGVVAEMADRVTVMHQGKQVETAPLRQLFQDPQQEYTRALLAAVPTLGAMHGQPLPAKFSLPGDVVAAASSQPDTVKRDAPPVLQVRDLVTRFDIRGGWLNRVERQVHAVEHVSFDLYAGETLALVGESGCGKSTTGRSLLRLVESQGGSITFNGQRIDTLSGSALAHLRRDIQFIFQDPYASLDPRQTVGFSIMEPLLVHNVMNRADAARRAAELLEKVGLLAEHASRYPHEFSGGQRQRICIARALALNPKVVIADESVSALDVSVQAKIINLMMDLQQEFGIAFLFISHDMAVVERISHRVAVMYLGQIVEIGPRQEVFENPRHPYTRKLMAAVPVADPDAPRHLYSTAAEEVPNAIYRRGESPKRVTLIPVSEHHFVADSGHHTH